MQKLTTETYKGPELKQIQFFNNELGGVAISINGEQQHGITMILMRPGEIKIERLYKDGKPIDKNGNPKK